MATIRIDNVDLHATDGRPLMDILREQGKDLPAMCYHPDLPVEASCRLCLVEVEGEARPHPACTLTASDGLTVRTQSASVEQLRRDNLELLAGDYVADQPLDSTYFGRWLTRYGVEPKATGRQLEYDSDPHPSIRVDLNQCILCTRCIRACDDVQGRFVWGLAERSHHAHIVAGFDTDMLSARCESCGACAAYCPSGALIDRAALDEPDDTRSVTTTCPYCGVGCNFDLRVKDDRIVRVASNPHAPVNGMHLCVKGRYGVDFTNHAQRLTEPVVRRYLLGGGARPGNDRGDWVPVSWDEALDIAASRLHDTIQRHGGDACAFMSSAKCTNEENYLMQKLARQVAGTHNIDHCARLCHSSTVAGLKAALGSGAMTNTMRDVAEQSAAIFVIGSNTTEQHPVFGSMLRQAVRQRGVPLVVADPRAIDLIEFATLHLQHRPGTDIALVNGLMAIMLDEDRQDQAFIDARTEGFEEVRALVRKFTPAHTETITGVDRGKLREAARILAGNRPMAVIWAMGITQHTTGVANVLSLANMQLMLGNLGVPGGGVNPLRGQNNVQGACDMGCLPNVFPGYQGVADAQALDKFARAWALDGEPVRFSEATGLTVTEMVDAAGDGRVKAMYVLGENAAMSDPDLNDFRENMAASEFVVLQEIFESESARYADVLLPGAGFAEKDGSFTNTERRIQLIRRAVGSPGEARPDWTVTAELARRVLARQGRTATGAQAGWDYPDTASIMKEVAALTASYAGALHERLDAGEALHWPVTGPDHPGTPILHVGGFTHGRGVFHPVDHIEPAELPDADYPLCLTTGRVLYHWHGAEMTRRSATLSALYPETLVEVAAEDAERAGIDDGAEVVVRSRRGFMRARAWVTDRVPEGVVFGNFHFPGEHNINNVTNAALDPEAKIPEYKACAVRIENPARGAGVSPA